MREGQKTESLDANLARELKAVAENPSTPQMAEMTTTNQTALTGVCVEWFTLFQ